MTGSPPASDPARHTPKPALEARAAELHARRASLAVILDFDGTLSPIVDDPAAAAPDPQARRAIDALGGSVALVACVTGRPALTARELLGVNSISYTGLHGAEVLAPGAEAPLVPAAFAEDGRAVAAIVSAARAEAAGLAGLTVEEKGPIIALHWRTAANPEAAATRARELGARAKAAGLRSGEGRSVLELRPGLEVTKGDGARALLTAVPHVRHAIFAGDDITDLDGFHALRELVRDGTLESATLVAVAGADAPEQVAAAADLVVPTPAALGDWLLQVATGVADDAHRSG